MTRADLVPSMRPNLPVLVGVGLVGATVLILGVGGGWSRPSLLLLAVIVPGGVAVLALRNTPVLGRVVVGLATALAVNVIVAEVMLAADAFSPTRGLAVVAVASALLLPVVLRRSRADAGSSRSGRPQGRGGDQVKTR